MRRAQCICNRYRMRAFDAPPEAPDEQKTARILDQDSQARLIFVLVVSFPGRSSSSSCCATPTSAGFYDEESMSRRSCRKRSSRSPR